MEAKRKQERAPGWMELEERKVAIEQEKFRVMGEDVMTKKMEQYQNIVFAGTSASVFK